MLRLALYQPDIPQNAGTIARLCAGLGVDLDIIEPAGFDVSNRAFRRAGMDYLPYVTITRHPTWDAFLEKMRAEAREIVLATTHGSIPYTQHTFSHNQVILLGRESAGVPENVHNAANARVFIPMRPHTRSLNVAVSAAMLLGEAVRQNNLLM
jgi:tRNA (cytidine/uridine-2'-O-)-methyltransferase